jgi:hypothetical protein
LHFELWIFCVFARQFTCSHLHLCCGFLHLLRVVVVFFFFHCFLFASLLHLAILLCYLSSHLVALPCCLLSHLVVRHVLLFTIALVAHLRTLLFVVMPNYLPLRLVVCLLFFQVPLVATPLLFCYLVARLHSLMLCLFMSIGILSPLSYASGRAWNNINKIHSTS